MPHASDWLLEPPVPGLGLGLQSDVFSSTAGLAAVVIEKKNQIDGSKTKLGDITIQYHRGFATSAFDVTIAHPLQKFFFEIAIEEASVAAEEATTESCLRLSSCARRKAFTLYPWLGSQQEAQLGPCMRLFASGLSWSSWGLSCVFDSPQHRSRERHLAQAVIDRRVELVCDRVL